MQSPRLCACPASRREQRDTARDVGEVGVHCGGGIDDQSRVNGGRYPSRRRRIPERLMRGAPRSPPKTALRPAKRRRRDGGAPRRGPFTASMLQDIEQGSQIEADPHRG